MLHIDIETYSAIPIAHGVYKYAEASRLLLFGYAYDDQPPEIIDCVNDFSGVSAVEEILHDKYHNNVVCCAHNAEFERVVLSRIFGDWVSDIRWLCTKAIAYQHSLPGALAQLSEIMQLGDSGKGNGKDLIQKFCLPEQYRRTIQYSGADWDAFIAYCKQDVVAEQALFKSLPHWNLTESEINLYQLDQRINSRGFLVDTELAHAAINATVKDRSEKCNQVNNITNGVDATQRNKMLAFILQEYGINLPDMQKSTIRRRINDENTPAELKELLYLRLGLSGTSSAKYNALLRSVSSDHRLRGTLQYCGAPRTGRWSGRTFQPQNLPRPTLEYDEIVAGIDALKSGCADLTHDIEQLCASAIRSVIIAPAGEKLVVADLSAIEGRGLAYLANESWKIDAYRNGEDLYVLTYAKTFGVDYQTVTPKQRQMGKVLELALGYGGGVGAFLTFANAYNLDLRTLTDVELPIQVLTKAEQFWDFCVDEKRTLGLEKEVFIACDGVKRLWRQANPAIVGFWYALQDAARAAIETRLPQQVNRCTIDMCNNWMRLRLPSGRYMCYPGARIEAGKIRYLGLDTYTRKWGSVYTYGGKLAENATQGFSRDVFAHGMTLAENAGYQILLTVHDEMITQVPDTTAYNASTLEKLMSRPPEWAPDLPLEAKGFETKRYRKG